MVNKGKLTVLRIFTAVLAFLLFISSGTSVSALKTCGVPTPEERAEQANLTKLAEEANARRSQYDFIVTHHQIIVQLSMDKTVHIREMFDTDFKNPASLSYKIPKSPNLKFFNNESKYQVTETPTDYQVTFYPPEKSGQHTLHVNYSFTADISTITPKNEFQYYLQPVIENSEIISTLFNIEFPKPLPENTDPLFAFGDISASMAKSPKKLENNPDFTVSYVTNANKLAGLRVYTSSTKINGNFVAGAELSRQNLTFLINLPKDYFPKHQNTTLLLALFALMFAPSIAWIIFSLYKINISHKRKSHGRRA